MAYIKTKMRHYNGSAWDTVYLQTAADLVLREDGQSVEQTMKDLEDDVTDIKNKFWYEVIESIETSDD